jgi:hypothetical protein
LHSVADGSGTGAVTANLTPLSELVVAKALGINSTPADAFASFTISTASNLSTSKLSEAKKAMLLALAGTVNLDSGVDPLTTSFKVGDSTDKQLDALKAKLTAAGTSLSDLSNVLVTAQTTDLTAEAPSITNILSPLPSNLTAAGCKGVHNGIYVSISQRGQITELNFDYNALSVQNKDGSTGTIAINSGGGCRFTLTYPALSKVVDAVFGPSGVGSYRATATGCAGSATTCDSSIGLFFPKQTIASLNDLEGTYDFAAYERSIDTTIHHFGISTGKLAKDGTYVGYKCGNTSGAFNCVDENNKSTVSFSVSSGLVITDDGAIGYPFRASDGTAMVVFGVLNGNGIRIATKQKSQTLPVLSAVHKFWDTYGSETTSTTFNSFGEISADHTIVEVNIEKNYYKREDGNVYYINTPADGFIFRIGATSPTVSPQVLLKVGTFLSFYGNQYVANESRSSVGFVINQ